MLGKLQIDMRGYQADGEILTSKRADFYISYATAHGDQSYRHIEKGSIFIEAVCRTLYEKSKQSSLNVLQHFINNEVADHFVYVSRSKIEYKQQPTCSDQLRSNVHFFYESTS